MSPVQTEVSCRDRIIVELSSFGSPKEGPLKIDKVFDIIFLQILSINIVKKKFKNNSHVRYLLNFQSKKLDFGSPYVSTDVPPDIAFISHIEKTVPTQFKATQLVVAMAVWAT
jgi:hypothetical protein